MKKLFTFFAALLIAATTTFANAESLEEVTLTVTSDGPTKDEAIKNALRSAIEQTFGAFVSANTTLLNDDLVKDEIVTISNGSIKNYQELSATPTANGGFSVAVIATVSLPHLISYAKSHGSECEFAGNSFGMEMKLRELKRQNELKTLYNLSDQILRMLPDVMYYELTVDEPRVPYEDELKIHWKNFRIDYFKDYSPDDWYNHLCQKVTDHLKRVSSVYNENASEEYYTIPMTIKWKQQTDVLTSLINNTLKSLSMSEQEAKDYRRKNIKYTEFDRYNLRNSNDDIFKWEKDLLNRIIKQFNSFVIVDNTGTISDFYPDDVLLRRERVYSDKAHNEEFNRTKENSPVLIGGRTIINGTGIFHDLATVNSEPISDIKSSFKEIEFYGIDHYAYNQSLFYNSSFELIYNILTANENFRYSILNWKIKVIISKDEIGKYSKFWVEPKN